MTRHTARASRTGLVIIGLILLLGAGAVLARALNASTTVLGNPARRFEFRPQTS